ncbi:MAG: DinB family protein [Phycisphaeraceae bacterium]|nr:MAG: DinB family protein [Phycisphaeraceae bacterium]
MPSTTDPIAAFVAVVLDGSFTGQGWQGPTLSGSLRGVSSEQAQWSPSKSRKSIWRHVLHAAYWKHAVARALDPTDETAFPRRPSNWPNLPPKPDEKAWKADRALLAEMHDRLRRAAASIDTGLIHTRPRGRKWTYAQYLAGAAAHDAYHLGQIQLLKRLSRERA